MGYELWVMSYRLGFSIRVGGAVLVWQNEFAWRYFNPNHAGL